MDTLPKIPIPLRLRWREFRYGAGPFLMFAGMLTLTTVLWTQVTGERNAIGIAEGVRSLVSSPMAGRLVALNVRPYQLVRQGDPVAVLLPADPRASLDLWRGEVELLRLRMQPSVAEQNAMGYERLRLELAGTKSELAIARINLQRAENDLARNLPLYKEKLVAEDVYDLSLQTRNALRAEIEEKSRAVAEIEDRMVKLRALADPEVAPAELVSRSIDRLERMRSSLSNHWGPILLEAPISGMVGGIFRQEGESVVEGEAVVTIYSAAAERVVVYLRQPYAIDPAVGMPVKVTSRHPRRWQCDTSISQVGAQLEVITNALANLKPGALVDVGLPVVVNLPADNKIRAGELVDVYIKDPHPEPMNLRRLFFAK